MGTETPTCTISIKIITHIFAANTFIYINVAETFNCIIAKETVTFIIATEPKKLHNCTCIIAIKSVICIVATETATFRIDHRNFHLQKWCQSEILLVIIKKLSK